MENEKKVYPIAVIGGGAAGTMSVLRSVLNNDEVLLLPGHYKVQKKSRDLWVNRIENTPTLAKYKKGVQDTGKETLKWIKEESGFGDNLTLMKGRGVDKVVKNDDGTFDLTDNEGDVHTAKYVILCTGVMDGQLVIDGSHQDILPYANAQKVEYCARCDGHHTHGSTTVILGHQGGAAAVACLLSERYSHPSMTIITHGEEPNFSEEQNQLIERYEIEVFKSKIKEVDGDPKKGLLKGFRLEDGNYIHADYAFVCMGMLVYNELATQMGCEVDDRGFVVTDGNGLSSVEGFYVAGDLRAGTKKQIYTAWDTAVDAADNINLKIRQHRRKLILASDHY